MELGLTADGRRILKQLLEDETAKREHHHELCRQFRKLEAGCPPELQDVDFYNRWDDLRAQIDQALDEWHLAQRRREQFATKIVAA